MAVEITFGIQGKETTQAFFIQDNDWEITLSKVRKLIETQELYTPEQYRFLTITGNAISCSAEDHISLKDTLLNYNKIKSNEEKKSGSGENQDESSIEEENEVNLVKLKECSSSADPEEVEEKKKQENQKDIKEEGDLNSLPKTKPDDKDKSSQLQLWVTPLKTNSSNDNNSEGQTQTNPNQQENPNPASRENGVPRRCMGLGPSHCPYTLVREAFSGPGGAINPKAFLKILIPLSLLLFLFLALLTVSMHLLLNFMVTFATNQPLLFKGFGMGGDDSQTDAVRDLKVRLAQLERDYKYDLTNRMSELEDLYLRDLAIHKKELNVLKKQIGGFVGENDNMDDIDDRMEEEEEEDFTAAETKTTKSGSDNKKTKSDHAKIKEGKKKYLKKPASAGKA